MNPLLLEAITKNDTKKFQQLLKESDEGIGKDTLLSQKTKVYLDTSLHLACRFGHVNLVADIVSLQPDLVAATNAAKETPVHEACRGGNVEMLEILLGVNPWVAHWVNDKHQSGLFLACENGHHQLVRLLLLKNLEYLEEIGADLPCLLVAVSRGYAAVVQELIQAWPRLAEKVNENGCNSLHHACRFGNLEVTRMLLILYPELTLSYDNGGFTPIHIAAIFGKAAVLKEFDDLTPSTFHVLTAKDQETVLHLMVRHNQVAAFFISMQFVGDCDALFDTCDASGNSLLHVALTTRCLEVAEYLIYKATREQLETRNYTGFTPMDILEASNQDDLATQHLKDCLLNRLAKIDLAQLQQQHHQGTERTNGRVNGFVSDTASQVGTTSNDDQDASFQRNQENLEQKELQNRLIKSQEAEKKLQKMIKEQKEDNERRRQSKMQAMHMEALQNARNTIIIISVLITTVTFTASLSPPGGFFQGGPHIGKPVLGQTTAFKVFAISNDIALFLSLCIVIVLVSIVPFRKGPLRKLLALAHKALWLAVSFLATAYVASRWATMQQVRHDRRLFGVVLSICGGFLGAVFLGSSVMLISKKLKKSEWRKQRDEQGGPKSFSTDSDMESNVRSGYYWY